MAMTVPFQGTCPGSNTWGRSQQGFQPQAEFPGRRISVYPLALFLGLLNKASGAERITLPHRGLFPEQKGTGCLPLAGVLTPLPQRTTEYRL